MKLTRFQSHKIRLALTQHVYAQIIIALLASLFCACIVFIALFDIHKNNFLLWNWTAFFVLVTLVRLFAAAIYKTVKHPENHLALWRNTYIVGSLLGGITWGLAALFLLPPASDIQQTLLILMIAGVTAGAVPLSAAIPAAAIAFLLSSLVPLIVSIAFLNNPAFLLFDAAILLYLVYTVVLTIKTYKLIKSSIVLQFENNELLNKLELTNIKLEYAATHDPLTSVANRTLFKATFEKAIENAKTNNQLLALFYIDLDHFKLANDTFGHQAGDHVLKVLFERLTQYLRKKDIIGRLGGDELAILIENVDSKKEIKAIAKRVCQLMDYPIQLGNLTLNISASMGISIFPTDGQDPETLMRAADKGMYFAKERGGNGFYFSEDVRQAS